jgi:hypothetical protein
MGTKRKTMKCGCGGKFEEKTQEIKGIKCSVMACGSCQEIIFTLEQSKAYHKLRQIQDELSKETKKISKVGNSMGITLPIKLKELGFDIGKSLDMRILDSRHIIIELFT